MVYSQNPACVPDGLYDDLSVIQQFGDYLLFEASAWAVPEYLEVTTTMNEQDSKGDKSEIRKNLKQPGIWMRALYMLLFSIIYGIAEIVIFAIVLFQFLIKLFTARTNARLLRLGQSLSTYVYQILLFVTFNSEKYPYPFSEWPKGPPAGGRVSQDTSTDDFKESLTDLQDYNDGD